MGEYPIIFSAPMIRALLEGRKTQTRRLAWRGGTASKISSSAIRTHAGKQVGRSTIYRVVKAPSPWQGVKPDDRLWVRESLTHITSDPVSARPCSVHCYTASIPPGMDSANPYEPNYLFSDDGDPALKPRNVSAIHMPRWASRLTLVVTATKTELLQEISEDDAKAEGCGRFGPDVTPREMFENVWSGLHGADSWDANPEVVALTFLVEYANIGAQSTSRQPKAGAG